MIDNYSLAQLEPTSSDDSPWGSPRLLGWGSPEARPKGMYLLSLAFTKWLGSMRLAAITLKSTRQQQIGY